MPLTLLARLEKPLCLPLMIDRSNVESKIKAAVDLLQISGVERIRKAIREEFFDGLKTGRFTNKSDFAELMFPDAESANARRCLIDRMLGNAYTGPGCKVSPDAIVQVGRQLGLPVNEWLDRATSMNAKRNGTANIELPEARTSWANQIGDTPALPSCTSEITANRFSQMLGRVGLPSHTEFSGMAKFDKLVDSFEEWAPNSTGPERFHTGVWAMFRPFLSGFHLRLRHAGYLARERGDPTGNELLHHIDVNECVLRSVQKAGRKLGWPNVTPMEVIKTAERRLSRHNVLTVVGLETFLGEHQVTVQAVCDRLVGVGWFIWQNERARLIANDLLRS